MPKSLLYILLLCIAIAGCNQESLPIQPTHLWAKQISNTLVQVTWNKVVGAKEYIVLKKLESATGTSDYSEIYKGGYNLYFDTKIPEKGIKCYYAVKASNALGYGATTETTIVVQ